MKLAQIQQSEFSKPSSSSWGPHNTFPFRILLRSKPKIQLSSSLLDFDITSDTIFNVTFDITFDVPFEVTFDVVFAVRCQISVLAQNEPIVQPYASDVRRQVSGDWCKVSCVRFPEAKKELKVYKVIQNVQTVQPDYWDVKKVK